MINNDIFIPILKDQVKPALGCTEPGAVALAVARARDILEKETSNRNITKIDIIVNGNILKNGMGVGIPGTQERGLVFAAALGLVVGKTEYGLEVLKDVDEESTQKSLAIEKSGLIHVELDKNADKLFISVRAHTPSDKATVTIKNSHTNIVFESINDRVILDKDCKVSDNDLDSEIKREIRKFDIDNLIDFATNSSIEDLSFIQDGIDMNLRLADIGVSQDMGMGYGRYLYGNITDVYSKAKAYTSGASEARMSGYPLPVMSSAGSGNHGLVAIIPISIIGKEKNFSDENIIRAVTLSHLITIYIKSYIGSLSPVCGCGVAAGVGCAAGLTYMEGGSPDQIKRSITNMVAGVTGMICDGAKLGCSYKLTISVDSAVDASNMALKNIFVPLDNGILGETAELTIENLAKISNLGMHDTDSVILDVMLNNC